MKRLKLYFTRPALETTNDVFEMAQINLTYDLTFGFALLYILMIAHNFTIRTSLEFDLVNLMSLIGIVSCFPVLRVTKSYRKAGFTFWITGIFVSTAMILLAQGKSDLQFGVWHSFSIVMAFSFVGRKFGLINAIYLIIVTALIVVNAINGWNLFDIGLDRGPDVNEDVVPVIIPMIAVAYIMFQTNKTRNSAQLIMAEQRRIEMEQRTELERKNLEITDSITYAKRIQSALLPTEKKWKDLLPESFIFYAPKDIVAGDFYWIETIVDTHNEEKPEENTTILFAAADCTGHGVPGAMVSVVCYNAMNRAVREFNLTDPGMILDKTRDLVTAEFEKSENVVKDGMDIALCGLSRTVESAITGNQTPICTLRYAGAHNPLWVIRAEKNQIEEYRANKQPIGKFYDPRPFATHSINLKKGDQFFIFSDGFADQFGGENGKKYKAKNFKKFLESLTDKSANEQKQALQTEFENWKDDYEQLDDVCVIGVRI